MTSEEREQMKGLCAAIQEEQEYGKFATLLREMSELIAKKEQRRFKDYPKVIWRRSGPSKSVPAVVKKIVKAVHDSQPERIEISIPEADDLYREIRIVNQFTDLDGEPVALTDGAQVDVTFEARSEGPLKVNPSMS